MESFSKDVTGNAHYTKSPHDGEHSDNCSEVSDEGYRSLGAVQPTSGNGNPGTCTQGSPTVADCQSEYNFFFSYKGYQTIKDQAIVSHDVIEFNILQNSQNCKIQMECFRGLNVKEQKSIASINWEKMTNEMRGIL